MKCKDCTVHDCTYKYKDGNTKCYYETPYWNHFRAEAAKDILCAMIPEQHNIIGPNNVEYAIMIADELIKQLKEKEEK